MFCFSKLYFKSQRLHFQCVFGGQCVSIISHHLFRNHKFFSIHLKRQLKDTKWFVFVGVKPYRLTKPQKVVYKWIIFRCNLIWTNLKNPRISWFNWVPVMTWLSTRGQHWLYWLLLIIMNKVLLLFIVFIIIEEQKLMPIVCV